MAFHIGSCGCGLSKFSYEYKIINLNVQINLIITNNMHDVVFPDELKIKYKELQSKIKRRLEEFQRPKSPEDYFYELCFCICTPQSKAKNAYTVELELRKSNFLNMPFDPVNILRRKENYIRFHNRKSKRLLDAIRQLPAILNMLESSDSPKGKRMWLVSNFEGFGMKEASHYLRNIGYNGLAILDRHILKHLVGCRLYKELPKIASIANYIEIENDFLKYSEIVNIPVDELDLLFWSYETGRILK